MLFRSLVCSPVGSSHSLSFAPSTMRFATVAAAFACASSALAFQIIVPSEDQPWNDQGSQVFVWTYDPANDRANFSLVIQNPEHPELLPTDQTVFGLVNSNGGSANGENINGGNITVPPPSGGWKQGPGFRLQIVDSATNLTGILAESEVFEIKEANVTTSSTRSMSFSTTLRNSATENPDAIPTDDTLPPADDGSAFAFKAPIAVAAAIALVPAFLL